MTEQNALRKRLSDIDNEKYVSLYQTTQACIPRKDQQPTS